MTATTGVVKSIAKENGVIVSVTLADGTVLKQSVLANNAGDREHYVIGNVYTFVLILTATSCTRPGSLPYAVGLHRRVA